MRLYALNVPAKPYGKVKTETHRVVVKWKHKTNQQVEENEDISPTGSS
jgi:hypothetical protein